MGLFSKKSTPPVIDLREIAPKAPQFVFGYPTRCPRAAAGLPRPHRPVQADPVRALPVVLHEVGAGRGRAVALNQ